MYTLTVPKPESFFVSDNGTQYYGKHYNVQPYGDLHWQAAVEKFGIILPAHIVSRHEGKTICGECGSVYVGHQPKCTATVPIFDIEYGWSNRRIVGPLQKGDVYRETDNGREYVVLRSYIGPCDSSKMSWDLLDKFHFQEGFFNLLSNLSQLLEKDSSPLAQYSEFIPHSKYDLIDLNLIRNRLDNIEMQQSAIVNAIKQIAERMSQAGSALNIGNL